MAAVTGAATGHANVRATHAKTLELVREPDIGPRATCVIAVAAELDEEALAGLHGRVELAIEAGGESARVRGRLNPAFRPGDPLIVRRAAAVTRDALLIDADTVAADLPRPLVAALAQPGAPVALRVAELPGEPAPGVLVAGPADDDDARAAVLAAHAAGTTVLPAPGLPPAGAVLAVAGMAGAGCTHIDGRENRPRDVDWDAAGDLLIADAPAERIPKWLRRAERDGRTRGAIGLDIGTPREQYLPWRAGEPLELPRGSRAALALAQPERTADTSSVSRPDPRTRR